MPSSSAVPPEIAHATAGADARDRVRFFPPVAIAAFAAAMAGVLVLAFPSRNLQLELSGGERGDELTIAYLHSWLRAKPDAHAMRLALARQHLERGELAPAREALDIVMRDMPGEDTNVADLDIELATRELATVAPDSPRYAALRERLLERLRRFGERALDGAQRFALVQRALALNDAALARQQLELAIANRGLSAEALMTMSTYLLGLGDHDLAARLAFAAQAHSTELATRRRYFLAGINALRASGRPDRALNAAVDHIGNLADDRDTLIAVIKLAREANRLDVAERYAKRLLRMSSLSPAPDGAAGGRWLAQAAQWLIASAHAAESTTTPPTAAPESTTPPGRPFDAEAYALTYDVFVAGGRLNEAQRVAEAAVRAQPNSAAWLRRLAQVAEWNGQPARALNAWWTLARQTNDEAAWDRVLAIAPGVLDYDAWIAAIEHRRRTRPDAASLDLLMRLYEQLGQPERALDIARREAARLAPGPARADALTRLGELAERAGQPDIAYAAWRELFASPNGDPTHAMRAVRIDLRLGRLDAALDLITQAVRHPGYAALSADAQADIRRVEIEVAYRLQRRDTLDRAFRELAALDKIAPDQLLAWADLLEADGSPSGVAAASRVLEFAARRASNPAVLDRAFAAALRAGDEAAVTRLLALADTPAFAQVASNPNFLSRRAQVRLARGDRRGALADARRALALRPADQNLRASWIWMLIAAREAQALRAELQRLGPPSRIPALLIAPAAAGWLALQEPERALPYFAHGAAQGRDDPSWLIGYADAIDAAGQTDLAWHLRARAWTMWMTASPPSGDEDARERERRIAALALTFAPSDAARARIAALVAPRTEAAVAPPTRVDTRPPITAPALLAQVQALLAAAPAPASRRRIERDAQADEIALSAALGADANELARAWMHSRFGATLARPAYADIALALADHDRERLAVLLDTVADWLPMRDRVEALERLGRYREARVVAFDHLAQSPRDDQAHARFASTWMPGPIDEGPARSVGTYLRHENARPLGAFTTQIAATTPIDIDPIDLRLHADATHIGYRNLDTAQLANVPAGEQQGGVTLDARLTSGRVRLRIGERLARRDLTQASLAFDDWALPELGDDWRFSARLALNDVPTEQAALRLGGTRDTATAGASWTVSPRDRVDVSLSHYVYRGQTGTRVGSGTTTRVDVEHRLRLSEPDLAIRAHAQDQRFNADGEPDAVLRALVPAGGATATARQFIPLSAREFGVALSTGEAYERGYTRAWRPFARVGFTHNTVAGNGADLRIGFATGVFGADTLAVSAGRVPGTAGSPSGATQFEVRYRILF